MESSGYSSWSLQSIIGCSKDWLWLTTPRGLTMALSLDKNTLVMEMNKVYLSNCIIAFSKHSHSTCSVWRVILSSAYALALQYSLPHFPLSYLWFVYHQSIIYLSTIYHLYLSSSSSIIYLSIISLSPLHLLAADSVGSFITSTHFSTAPWRVPDNP